MSANIWNLKHPLRTGFVKLAGGGLEKFGTVIRQGRMDKTVTVRTINYRWNFKVGFWLSRSRNLHCHDPENYCRIGDKVVIAKCRKIAKIKNYYVRNIVLATGRQNFYTKDMTKYEKNAMEYNR